jgi:hypothetical protein
VPVHSQYVLNATEAWEGMCKIGGALLIVAGVLYFANLVLVISQGGALPTNGTLLLGFVAQRSLIIQATSIVFFAIDGMLALAFAALFLALRGASRTYAAIGGVLALVGLTIDFINTLFFYSLVGLGQSFVASSSDVAKASYASIAEFVGGVSAGIGEAVYFTLFSIAILAISAAMLSGHSWKAAGYLGLITGVLGIAAGISGFVPLIILWPVWFIVAGAKLFKLGQSSTKA